MRQLFAVACLLLPGSASVHAADRVSELDRLVKQWQQLHDSAEMARKEHAKRVKEYLDLDRRHDVLAPEIGQHERQADQAQRKKKANNKNDKNPKNNKRENEQDRREDQRLEQEIRQHHAKVRDLKQKQMSLRKEADRTAAEGKKLEQQVKEKVAAISAWRDEWAKAADFALAQSAEEHAAFLKRIENRGDGKGPMAEAWSLVRAAAQAGTGEYDAALKLLEPLAKDGVWGKHATALRKLVKEKQKGDE